MMFVGDSLNRGQYVSFVCLLHSLIPEDAKSMETFDSLTVFTAKVTFNYCNLHLLLKCSNFALLFCNFFSIVSSPHVQEYNATIEFYWAPFLLESNSDNAVVHRISDRIVRKGSINKHGRHWKGVDILVFNSYLWWMTGVKMKILYDLAPFRDGAKGHKGHGPHGLSNTILNAHFSRQFYTGLRCVT